MDFEYIRDCLEEHGEVHLVVEEHDAVTQGEDDYIGLRLGNTEVHEEEEVFEVDDGSDTHHVPADRIVYIQEPGGFPD